MKAVQDTYCTLEFLSEAYTLRKESLPHKVAWRIVRDLSNVYLDIDVPKFYDLIKSNPYISDLFQRPNKTFEPKQNWKSEISFESNNDTVYFIHPNYIKDYKKIRQKKGCLIVSSDNDINWLERLNNKLGYVCIVPKLDRNLDLVYQDSWEEAIKTFPINPINSLIITDNYFFSHIELRKEKSLFSILRSVVPKDLDIPFHLAIFSYIGRKNPFPKEDADKLIDEIKNIFGKDKIKVTIVVHTQKLTTHDREILSNYHRITSGVGFNVIDEEGIKEVARGDIKSVFHSIAASQEEYMVTKHDHLQTLSWLKEIYTGKTKNASTLYITGDKEHRMLD